MGTRRKPQRGTKKVPPNVERMTSGSFRARIKVEGKTLRGKARETAKEAYEDALKLLESNFKRGGPKTIRQAFDAIVEDCKRRRRRPATIRYYEEQKKVIEAQFGAAQRVATIRVADVQKFVDDMLEAGNSPSTVRTRLRALRRAFIICGRSAVGARELVIPDVEEPDPSGFLTLPKVLRLLRKLAEVEDDQTDYWFVSFLVVTGVRRSELARMRKSDLDEEGQRILVRTGKTNPRVLPLPDARDARAVVETLNVISDSEWIVPGDTEQKRVDWLVRMGRRIRKFEPRASLHNLRKATASLLMELDPPPPVPVVAHLLGHSLKNQIGVTGIYSKPSPAVVREVAARLWRAVGTEGEDRGARSPS